MFIGIDYGTSTTCAAFDTGAGAQVIPWPDKGHTGPSVVFVPPDGRGIMVGRRALAESKDHLDFLFSHVKRLFDVNATGEDTGHQTVKGLDGKVWLRGPTENYAPSQIAACVIEEVLDFAEFRLKARPDGAVLTHPAMWSTPQKNCLRDAASSIGLEHITLLPEPSAASYAYRFDLGPIRQYAIYDWGAGTFDFALVMAGKNACDTKWSDGLSVGGVDVDEAIVEWLKDEYRNQYGVDLGMDIGAMIRLRQAAEKAKIDLSTLWDAKIEIPLIETLPARTLKAVLTRDKLEELAKPFIDKTLAKCAEIMTKAGLTNGNIAEVILVGGMTNMPCVGDAVQAFFGRKPRNDVDPDEAVARGAATYAAMLEKRTKATKLINRVDHDFGIETSNDVIYKVMTKGTLIPAKEPLSATVVMTTEQDGQERISFHILEGDGGSAAGAVRLAAIDFDIEPATKGEPSVELIFSVDPDGRKTVTGPNGVIYEGIANG